MVALMLKRFMRFFGRTRFKGYTLKEQRYKPMLRLLRELGERGVDVAALDALEIFGRDGLDHTTTYADRVRTLEVWEINETHHPRLRANLPKASIRIVDSYEEIARTPKRFDFVVIDNAIGTYGLHCDHFGLFPDKVFAIARDRCVIAVNVIPRIDRGTLKHFPDLLGDEYLERRGSFYGASDARHISMDRMIDAYRGFAGRNGFRLAWSFHIKRSDAGVHYLVLGVERTPKEESRAPKDPGFREIAGS